LVSENNKLGKVVRTIIKECDKDHNGYVTNQELDDIIKIHYPELAQNTLVSLFSDFQDPIQNILVDYKKFAKGVQR
jgi:Ca2+-binding EF-hand superfamily protein